MKKIMRKGDDFLSISETISEMVIQMGLLEINNGSNSGTTDYVSADFSIEIKKIRKKKTPQNEDCSTCIYQDGACYPSTTIFDKDKKCKSYVKEEQK